MLADVDSIRVLISKLHSLSLLVFDRVGVWLVFESFFGTTLFNYNKINITKLVNFDKDCASQYLETILFIQLQCFSNKFISPLLCGFRKGYIV